MPFSIIPQKPNLNFLGRKWVTFSLSIAAILFAFVLLFINGLNFGIDFTGGIVIELKNTEPVDLGTIRKPLSNINVGEISLQHFGTERDVMIRVGSSEKADNSERERIINKIKQVLAENLGNEIDYRKVDFVGPQVGRELIFAGSLSLFLAFLAIMAYIWLRFEWQFGIGAIVALIHDTILTVGLFSLLRIEFNLTSIAAILTIIGYSINDSVVIYDRVRENLRKYKKMGLEELLNISINQTLSRTIITAGTTIAALISLVWLGGEVIRGFSIAVLFGIVVGTYSSIYIASPLLIFMNIRRK